MSLPRIPAVWTVALTLALVPGCGEERPAPVAPGSTPEPTPAVTALTVSLSVFGPEDDPDGFVIEVLGGGPSGQVVSRPVGPDGGTVEWRDLEPGAYDVAVTSVGGPCAVEGDNPRPVEVGEGRWEAIELRLSCLSAETTAAFERTSPGRYDRYFLDEDGTFLVDDGPVDDVGTWTLADGVYVFVFDYARNWGEDGRATGRPVGDCMTVSYGVVLFIDGYEDGTYCRLPTP